MGCQKNIAKTIINKGADYVLALKNNQTLCPWGRNRENQLGDGTRSGRQSPAMVGEDSDWLTVAAGDQHSAAIKLNGTWPPVQGPTKGPPGAPK